MEGQSSDKQEVKNSVDGIGGMIPEILPTAIRVITNPVSFYRSMSRTGGFLPPLVFMATMGIASAIVGLLLSIIGLGTAGFAMALVALILTPVLVAIFGFVGAAVVFVIWKLMGSSESYETAYRCVAYASAVMPITTLLGPIPYLGSIFGLLWTTYLLVVASTEVHGIAPRKAWIVFGAIALILAIASLSTEVVGRRMVRGLQGLESRIDSEDLENMSAEEAAEKVGSFLKTLEGIKKE